MKGTANAGLVFVRGQATAGSQVCSQVRAVSVQAGDLRMFVSKQNNVVTAENGFVNLFIVFYGRTVGDRYPRVRVDGW